MYKKSMYTVFFVCKFVEGLANRYILSSVIYDKCRQGGGENKNKTHVDTKRQY